ncbi:hypothetical protein D6833_04595 [Candidatus Parcubacteria bacterium]|nr:MAG: hypothetical protein D6833_04595 [Candidatus Parcubacteria bacterium]
MVAGREGQAVKAGKDTRGQCTVGARDQYTLWRQSVVAHDVGLPLIPVRNDGMGLKPGAGDPIRQVIKSGNEFARVTSQHPTLESRHHVQPGAVQSTAETRRYQVVAQHEAQRQIPGEGCLSRRKGLGGQIVLIEEHLVP